ncbi:MAG: hypothetical protein IPH49_03580 [Ignavibacteria bacterium]|nr:hypothetical protein [Ignavibacteria bacterium]
MTRPLLSSLVLCLVVIGCSPDEPLISSFADEWRLLTAGPNGLATYTMPAGDLANPSVWSGPVGTSYPASDIKRFRDEIYVLHSSQPWIVVINEATLLATDTIDLGTDGPASDIAFANATTAYVTLATTKSVGIVDVTTNTLVRTIALGSRPAGIASTGNQICVALVDVNEVAVIDSRTNTVEARIGVDQAPYYVEADDLNSVFCIVCLGSGKIDDGIESVPTIVFVSAASRAILKKLDVSGKSTNAPSQLPRGLVVTVNETAFVPVQNGLVRVNTRTRNKTTLIQFDAYDQIGYNPARAEIMVQRTVEGVTTTDVLDEYGEVFKASTTQADSSSALVGIGR